MEQKCVAIECENCCRRSLACECCLCSWTGAFCEARFFGDEREALGVSDRVGCQVHIEIGPI